MADKGKYEDEYSEEGFWSKLANYAKIAGIEVIEKALLLYYAAQEEDAPAWAKATIVASLGYFIAPLDAIIDTTPAWSPVVDALKNLRPGGRLVINAIRKEE